MLLHHYLAHTSHVLGSTDGDVVQWRDKVPVIAFKHQHVLRMMLAVAAIHLSRQRPHESGRYERLAEVHSTAGLQETTKTLSNITRDNCDALYISTVLVCYYNLAKRRSAGHLLVSAREGQVPWVALLRGVRYVVQTMGWEAIFSGDLGPTPNPNPESVVPTTMQRPQEDFQIKNWQSELNRIEDLLDGMEGKSTESARSMLAALIKAFGAVFPSGELSSPPQNCELSTRFMATMSWLYQIDDEFVNSVEARQESSLLILAYYAVLLATVESMWYMTGWARHLTQSVREELDPLYLTWLEWPAEQIDLILEASIVKS
jgi:hypothetical protein